MRTAALKALHVLILSTLATTLACAGSQPETDSPSGKTQAEVEAEREEVKKAAKVEGLVALANQDLERGRYVSALGRADEALADNPNNADAYVVKGAALWRAGAFEESTAAYEKAIEIDGKNFAGIIGLGRNLQAAGQHTRALELQDQLIATEADGFPIRPCVDGACDQGICDAGTNMCKPPMEAAPRLVKLWSQYLLLDVAGALQTADDIQLAVGTDEMTNDLVGRYRAFINALEGRGELMAIEGASGTSDLAVDTAGAIKHMSAILGEEYARTVILELQDECRIDANLVATLGLEAVAQVKPVGSEQETAVVLIPEVKIGDLTVKNVPALVQDLSSFEGSLGEVPGLVIGRQFMQRFGSVDLDFPAGEVVFNVEASTPAEGAQVLPLVMLDLHVLHIPAIPVSIDGSDHAFWAWLGGSYASMIAMTAKAYLKSSHRPTEIDPPDDEVQGLKMVYVDALKVGEASVPGGGGLVFTNNPAEPTLAKVTEVTGFELGGYLNVARLRNWKVSYRLPEGKVALQVAPAAASDDG